MIGRWLCNHHYHDFMHSICGNCVRCGERGWVIDFRLGKR